MTIALVMLDYERLAGAELGRATLSETAASRKRHLNRAAVYAHLAEGAGSGPAQSGELLNLIGALSFALDEADTLGLTVVAAHLTQAIVDLGGIGANRMVGDQKS